MARGKLQHSLRWQRRNQLEKYIISSPVEQDAPSRTKTRSSSWKHTYIQTTCDILVNIMACILFTCVVGYMFHRVNTQQVRGWQKEHTLLFSQHYNNNGSTQNQHIIEKKNNRRHKHITYDFMQKITSKNCMQYKIPIMGEYYEMIVEITIVVWHMYSHHGLTMV